MLAIDSPFPQYVDRDGLPLDGGSLHFGAPNQNPETAPITVYWDADGTQPAAQPVRTMNGYAARSGAPATLFVTADYSLTVKDKAGRLIFYRSFTAGGSVGLLSAELADRVSPTNGAARIGYSDPLAPTYLKTVSDIIAGVEVSVFRFLTKVEQADVQARTMGRDLTVNLNVAHAVGIPLRYPWGTYLFNSVSTASRGIRGDGTDATRLVTTSAVGDVILWNGLGEPGYSGSMVGPRFEHFSITSSVPRTDGAYIKIHPSTGEISFPTFHDIRLYNAFSGIETTSSSNLRVRDCLFINYKNAGLIVANETNPDSGDGYVDGCLFNNNVGTGTAIYQKSSGGLRIINNKFNGGAYHYLMAAEGNVPVADLLITGNSFENCVAQSLKFTRVSGTIGWGSISIAANQFGNNPTDILASPDSPDFISDFNIVANSFGQLLQTWQAIFIDNVDGFSITSNRLSGAGGASIGISIGASAVNGRVNSNTFRAVGTPYSNSSPTTLIDGRQRGLATIVTNTPHGIFYVGGYTFSFPIPYELGVIPNVSAFPVNGANDGISCFVAGITNTGAAIEVIGLTNGGNVPIAWTAS